MISLLAHLAMAACPDPAHGVALPMGDAPDADCAFVEAEAAGRAFAAYPSTGLSRGVSLPRARAEAGLRGASVSARGAVVVVRSGGADGYIGVDGESLVPAIQLAEARVDWAQAGLAAAAGVVDDVAVVGILDAWDLPAMASTLAERRGWSPRSDLGLWGSWTAPTGLVSLTVSETSGEGAARRDRNQGLDTTGVLRFRPTSQLQAQIWARDGSWGPLSAANHRAGLAAWYQSEPVVLGLDGTLGWGLAGDSDVRPGGLSVWGRAGQSAPVVAWARVDLASDQRALQQSWEQTVFAGVGPKLPVKSGSPAYAAIGLEDHQLGQQATPTAGAKGQGASTTIFLQLGVDLAIESARP